MLAALSRGLLEMVNIRTIIARWERGEPVYTDQQFEAEGWHRIDQREGEDMNKTDKRIEELECRLESLRIRYDTTAGIVGGLCGTRLSGSTNTLGYYSLGHQEGTKAREDLLGRTEHDSSTPETARLWRGINEERETRRQTVNRLGEHFDSLEDRLCTMENASQPCPGEDARECMKPLGYDRNDTAIYKGDMVRNEVTGDCAYALRTLGELLHTFEAQCGAFGAWGQVLVHWGFSEVILWKRAEAKQ